MGSILTFNHYINEANAFIDSVERANTAYYVYVSRPQPWSNTTGGDDDSAVPAVNNSVAQVELDVFDDILYGKKITAADVINMVPRYSWTSNTVYSAYDQTDSGLLGKSFYVVTTGAGDQYNVFKCIDNGGGARSTVKPTLQSTSGTFNTGDGYVWKYMYTIDATSNTKFMSTNFMPVIANAAVQANAVGGSIDAIRVVNAGSGYSVYETGVVESVLDRYTIKLPNTSSSLDDYYTNSSIYLKSGFGGGQIREISEYDGTSKNVTVVQPVDTYVRLDFSNSSLISSGAVGEQVRQVIDTINFTTSVGLFNSGDTIIQTDSGLSASVLTANSNTLRVSRSNKNQLLVANAAIRSAADSGTIKTVKANISNNSTANLGIVVSAGTGYTGNAVVTIASSSGSGAVANAQANSTGKIVAINVSNTGNGYASEPTVTVAAPTAQTFNANSAVTAGVGEGSNNVIALATAGVYVVGDAIKYYVSAGNTTLGGLSNNTTYYIQFANSTTVALSATSNTAAGNRVTLTKGFTETGHVLQGLTATGRILPSSMIVTNASATFSTDYSAGDFIRVGQNPNTNIRVANLVNSSVIVVDRPFINTISGANTFKLSTAFIPSTITVAEANGTISNSNLTGIRLTITNTSIVDSLYIVGEKVDLVTSANVSLNANGTVAYSNSTTLFLSGIQGSWVSGQRVKGNSSQLVADVVTVDTKPNVTIKNPSGDFVLGQLVDFSTAGGSNTGIANLVNVSNLTENSIEYEIGPTVRITGDGTGATGVATVNTAVGSGNVITKVTMITTGSGYTEANAGVYANTLYGSGAQLRAVIAPVAGHGADVYSELGARYVGVSVKFDTLANENLYYPSNVDFRRIGIIKDPGFSNVVMSMTGFNVADLELASQSGTWEAGEVVVQGTTNATGLVVSGNSTVLRLRDVRGTFVQSNTIYAYSSAAAANVVGVTTVKFQNNETVSTNAGSRATVVSFTTANNTLVLGNTQGSFSNGDYLLGSNTGAVATVNVITSSDRSRTLTSNFGLRFNQTSRVTLQALPTITSTFTEFEYVTQQTTGASGRIASLANDVDVATTGLTGSFSTGDIVNNVNTGANAYVSFANSTYLKLTAVSNNLAFSAGNRLTNGLGANCTVQNTYGVVVLSDVTKNSGFIPGYSITGANSGLSAVVQTSTNPDLTKELGKTVYVEISNTVINRTSTSTEEIRLIIKF